MQKYLTRLVEKFQARFDDLQE